MGIRKKLKDNPDRAIEIIRELDASNITPQDLIALIRIERGRPTDPLAHLSLEATWWLAKNWKILKERFGK